MPTYEYICDKCGLHFDQIQPITAKSLTLCPKEVCGQKKWGKGKVKRAIGLGGGLLFKGTGFYITDYRSEGYKTAAKADAPPVTATAGDAKTGEAKPSGPGKAAGDTKAATAPAKTESAPSKPKPAVK
jgi:putative FmdB family regulatory protein